MSNTISPAGLGISQCDVVYVGYPKLRCATATRLSCISEAKLNVENSIRLRTRSAVRISVENDDIDLHLGD